MHECYPDIHSLDTSSLLPGLIRTSHGARHTLSVNFIQNPFQRTRTFWTNALVLLQAKNEWEYRPSQCFQELQQCHLPDAVIFDLAWVWDLFSKGCLVSAFGPCSEGQREVEEEIQADFDGLALALINRDWLFHNSST